MLKPGASAPPGDICRRADLERAITIGPSATARFGGSAHRQTWRRAPGETSRCGARPAPITRAPLSDIIAVGGAGQHAKSSHRPGVSNAASRGPLDHLRHRPGISAAPDACGPHLHPATWHPRHRQERQQVGTGLPRRGGQRRQVIRPSFQRFPPGCHKRCDLNRIDETFTDHGSLNIHRHASTGSAADVSRPQIHDRMETGMKSA